MMNQNLKRMLAAFGASAVLTLGAAALDGGTVRVNSALNVRSAPTTASAVRGKLQSGRSVTLYEKSGDWWRIGYAGGSGYVYAAYIEEQHLAVRYVRTHGGNLNVRAAASTASAVIGSLPDASAVLILDIDGNFAKILLEDERVGYVSRDYLVIAAPTAGNDAVTLAVPSYKQYDSRWASRRLPGSGEKVSTHGCAVTALAMAESYRTGEAVTPTDILASEQFTASGAIYWPASYTWGDAALDTMRAALLAGKPVIVHVQKKSGSTHFVVVYGFTGGALDAANFRILDPGSESRTTLADLLLVYPNIVKTLY